MQRRTLLRAASALAPATLVATPELALAQEFPDKPIRYIVPVAAGGGSDLVGRTVTERWGKALGQPFVVDNQGGGGGVIACQNTARAAPDGYTLMQGYVATHGTSPATRKLPYDPVKDFTPIGMIGATPNVLVIDPKLPVKDFREFVAYLKAHPGKVSYGSAGAGSLTHLTMELMAQQLGTPLVHVPYRGIAPALTDAMGGQTQAVFPGLAAALQHIRAGRVRALAVTGNSRAAQLKDVPTLDELGLKNFDAVQWYGVVGPAGMPAELVRKLNDTLATVLQAPDMREKLGGEAVEPMAMTPQEFGGYIQRDVARWSALAKAQNISLD
ncbi:tripartite tricarboxylate transporter substrate binding protein [Xylophilus sp. GOD-11R]|uniref:Bug family tripartite tricarboxylate transporter substrate binding protein n=1 Tax=Xylophilus sp. GOD-11R TaxID=3089814 RepID=UPI00298C0D79|nr:tripartite tricarboxylate transporter substrate binding protein [Xylophilus sp. GOD-11R]WPB58925.1 tripartite tricarboxylate transporter substrate binding protein [Xylophilus sp. GOD-11R]